MEEIAVTRFNNKTWEENCNYRDKHDMKGCCYGTPVLLQVDIPIGALLYILEMNNDKNKIMGIGLIRNQHVTSRRMIVYSKGNYNRYVFKGKYRIDFNEIPADMVEMLNELLFKGKTHLKRGSGFTTITPKLLRHPVCNERDLKIEIYNLFKNKYNAISIT